MNAYDLLTNIRAMLGEATAVHWSDREILAAINRVQKRYYLRMSQTTGDWFVKKSGSLTPSGGQITLPADCIKPIYMEEVSSGREIPIDMTVRQRRLTRNTAGFNYSSPPRSFLLQSVIEVNQDSYANAVYLWYEQRCQDMAAGTASAGGAGSLTLPTTIGKQIQDDYYNGLYVEVLSGTGAGTRAEITDYVGSTGACSVAGTFGADSVFGTVLILPAEAEDVMALRVALQCCSKPAAVVNEDYLKWLSSEVQYAEKEFLDWIDTRVKNTQRIQPAADYYE